MRARGPKAYKLKTLITTLWIILQTVPGLKDGLDANFYFAGNPHWNTFLHWSKLISWNLVLPKFSISLTTAISDANFVSLESCQAGELTSLAARNSARSSLPSPASSRRVAMLSLARASPFMGPSHPTVRIDPDPFWRFTFTGGHLFKGLGRFLHSH